jgi:DNA helicase-2/ATP-dependent DNA helicase PcrA
MIKKGIYPSKILAVTFTNKAAKEMRERLVELLGSDVAKNLTVSTFHALGVRILREDGHKLGIQKNFVIYSDSDIERVIKTILKEKYKIDKVEPYIVRQIQYIMLEAKSNKITPSTFPTEGITEEMLLTEKVYQHYEDYLRIYGAVDFADLLVKPVQLFEDHEEIKEKYRKRYNFIMIDEYQDTNDIQFQFINHIVNENQNICVVGDDDQSIYGFRGANVGNILQFASQFANSKEIKLQQNYRSTETIIKAANAVIAKNSVRNKKTLFSNLGKGEQIKLYLLEDPEHEANKVAEKIQSLLRKDVNPKDIAVMYRGKHQSREVELKLKEREVPYKVVGSLDFYNRKEIKDFMSYLIMLVFPNDEIHLKRIINYPPRSIGSSSVQKISEYAHNNKKSFFTALSHASSLNLPPKTKEGISSFLSLIKKYDDILNKEVTEKELYNYVDDIKFVDQLNSESKSDKVANNKKRNLILFIDGMVKYINKANITLEEYLLKFALEPDSAKNEEEKDEVTLLTIHASKGLEYPYVFLLGFNDGILPHQRSLDTKKRADLEEERRLCYVAITRARKELILTAIEKKFMNGSVFTYELSRFLDEIPKEIINVIDFTDGKSDVPVEEIRDAVMGNLESLFDF